MEEFLVGKIFCSEFDAYKNFFNQPGMQVLYEQGVIDDYVNESVIPKQQLRGIPLGGENR